MDDHESFLELVLREWNDILTTACPIYILIEKIKHMKCVLKQWNADTFGSIYEELIKAKSTLDDIQRELDETVLLEGSNQI